MTGALRLKWMVLAVGVAVVVGVLVVYPLWQLAAVALDELDSLASLGTKRTRSAITNTMLVGSLVAFLALVFGVVAAFATERLRIPGRTWMRVGILLPILIPPFVSALSWQRAYGPGGLTDDLIGFAFSGLHGLMGVVVVIAVNTMPLAYLMTVAALNSRVDRSLEQAARASGASAGMTTRSVTLPLLSPALVGTAALIFVAAINAFGVPAILGRPAGFGTVTTRIYEDLALSARPEAFSRAILLAMGLVVTALVFVLIAEMLLAGVGRGTQVAQPAGPSMHTGRTRLVAAALAWSFVVITSVVPLIALILAALTKGVGLDPVPGNWTAANFAEALDPRMVSALMRSLGLAFAAATICLVLGGAVAALRNRPFGRAGGVAVLLAFAIPGSTLAVAMIIGYGRVLGGTLLLILIAYVAKLWAIGHRVIAGSSANTSPQFYFAARSSGASGFTALRTVVVPMLRPALFGAWVLVFLFAFHELTMSSLLYGPGSETLAVSILNLQQLGDLGVTSALAVILTLPLLFLAIPLLVFGPLPRRFIGAR